MASMPASVQARGLQKVQRRIPAPSLGAFQMTDELPDFYCCTSLWADGCCASVCPLTSVFPASTLTLNVPLTKLVCPSPSISVFTMQQNA